MMNGKKADARTGILIVQNVSKRNVWMIQNMSMMKIKRSLC